MVSLIISLMNLGMGMCCMTFKSTTIKFIGIINFLVIGFNLKDAIQYLLN